MKLYQSPILEVLSFADKDVICASDNFGETWNDPNCFSSESNTPTFTE